MCLCNCHFPLLVAQMREILSFFVLNRCQDGSRKGFPASGRGGCDTELQPRLEELRPESTITWIHQLFLAHVRVMTVQLQPTPGVHSVPSETVLSYSISIAVMLKIMTRNSLGMREVYSVCISGISPSREVRQGRNLEAGTEAEATEEHYLLASSFWLS